MYQYYNIECYTITYSLHKLNTDSGDLYFYDESNNNWIKYFRTYADIEEYVDSRGTEWITCEEITDLKRIVEIELTQ